MSFTVAAFYKFVELVDPFSKQAQLKAICEKNNILGTILLAPEGINSTIAGTHHEIQAVVDHLRSQNEFSDLVVKYSTADEAPFHRLKILIKKEIVTFGVPGLKPQVETGVQVPPEQWDDLISKQDVIVIDTRNEYEIEKGTFKGAIDPKTDKFTDFIDYTRKHLDPKQHKKVAMCCTGGIRCEKASAFLLKEGFENVYQLEGGILKYLEEVGSENSLWQGKCFIFDDREVVDRGDILK